MYHRRSVNVFNRESIKIESEPEQLFSKFPKPIKQIDQYIQQEDRCCLDAKRKFLTSMRSSSHFTHTQSDNGSVFSELESRSGGKANKQRAPGDFYLPGMPVELMSVKLKNKKRKKRKIKKVVKKSTKSGEQEANSGEEEEKKKPSDSESEEEEILSNSSGEEAGDYADTHFDNGEDYLPSDKSEGEGDFY